MNEKTRPIKFPLAALLLHSLVSNQGKNCLTHQWLTELGQGVLFYSLPWLSQQHSKIKNSLTIDWQTQLAQSSRLICLFTPASLSSWQFWRHRDMLMKSLQPVLLRIKAVKICKGLPVRSLTQQDNNKQYAIITQCKIIYSWLFAIILRDHTPFSQQYVGLPRQFKMGF